MLAVESLAVDTLRGIGAATRERIGKLGITTLFDLLAHVPLRYENRTRVTSDHSCLTDADGPRSRRSNRASAPWSKHAWPASKSPAGGAGV